MSHLTPNEEIRAIALTAASRSVRQGVGASYTENATEILDRAKRYEEYIRSGN